MKIQCVDSKTEYQSKIVGNPKAQLEDCINWLSSHLKARYPKVLSDLGLAAQMAIAAGVLAHAEPLDESEGSELWLKVREEHQEAVMRCMGLDLDEPGEEDIQEAYDMGFEECQAQISAYLEEKGLEALAKEVKELKIEQEAEQEEQKDLQVG